MEVFTSKKDFVLYTGSTIHIHLASEEYRITAQATAILIIAVLLKK